jgi:CRISPR-associated protein Cmr4
MNTRLLFTHALSPLHAGTGQGVGVIDLPIAREKATGIPYLPGSSLKGTLRDSCPHTTDKVMVYGPETNNADAHAGAAQFSDQRLLFLPIRSLAGTFAWVTSPYLLQRFLRDAANAGVAGLSAPLVADTDCLVAQYQADGKEVKCKLTLTVSGAQKVVLEDLDLTPSGNSQASEWAKRIGNFVFPDDPEWRQMFGERFCIVSDEVLSFLLDTATEITARIKLQEDTKTVKKGGLWYEEALPTETILYGLVLATPPKQNGLNEQGIFAVVRCSIQPVVQLGGKATVGRGLCRVLLQDSQQQAQPNQNAPTATAPSATTTAAMPQTTTPASTAKQISSAVETPAQAQASTPGEQQSKTTVRPLGVKKPEPRAQEMQKGGA